MPVTFTCDGCNKRLRVKDELAGKKIRCPSCSKVVTVEPEAEGANSGQPVPPPSSPSSAESGPLVEQWYLKSEDGEMYGPIPKPELDEWFGEGRVTADSQLLLDGNDQWQWASDVYPELEEGSEEEGPPDFSVGAGPAIGPEAPGGRTSTKKNKKKQRWTTEAGPSKILLIVAVVAFVFSFLTLAWGAVLIIAAKSFAASLAEVEEGDPALAAFLLVSGIFAVLLAGGIGAAGFGVMKRKAWGVALTQILGGVSVGFALLSLASLVSGSILLGLIGFLIFGGAGSLVGIVLTKKFSAEFDG
jgi:DNA-directed RNA polymerase subunit RPC12/RpoP